MSNLLDDLVIRVADVSDLGDLLDLYRHLIPDDLPATPETQSDTYLQMLSHPGLSVLVGFSENRLVASCTVSVVPNLTRACAPYAMIENVVTHPDYRGRGIGEKLLTDAVELAWNAGCFKVMLMSGVQNKKAHAFYDRLGFARSKTGFEMRRPGYPARSVES